MEKDIKDKPVWYVLWKPDCCNGFVVAKGLIKSDAEFVAARHEVLAKERSWAGRAEVVLTINKFLI